MSLRVHQPSRTEQSPARAPTAGQWFPPTSWTAVVAAAQTGSPQAKEALGELYQAYWDPLYAYVRRFGQSEHDAKDMIQGFFCRLLTKNYLGVADRQKGKFRNFLLTAFKRFLANEWERVHAAKRGGKEHFVSLDDDAQESCPRLEPASDVSPAQIFEQRWAMALFQRAHARLRAEHVAAGKADHFDRLKKFVDGLPGAGEYDLVATQLRMTKRAVTLAVYRLRQRFAGLVRSEVARTLVDPTPAEIEEELLHLFETLSR